MDKKSFAEVEKKSFAEVEKKSFAEVEKKSFAEVERKSFAEVERKSFAEIERKSFAEVEKKSFAEVERKSFAEIEKKSFGEKKLKSKNSFESFSKSDDFRRILKVSDDPHPEILADAIKLGKCLGKGSFGTVYEASLLGKTIAVKVLDSESGIDLEDQEFLNRFKHEISIMAKSHHPNIMLYIGACTSISGKLMIVTEKLKIDLETLLVKENPKRVTDISLEKKLRFGRDVSIAMAFLHSRDPAFLHLDLKPANILLDEYGVIKVADFGQTLQKSQNRTSTDEYQGGTPYYMSPEMLMGESVNEKADIYSFGICLYEIIYQKKAFAYDAKLACFILDVVEKNVRPTLEDQLTVPTVRNVPLHLKNLVGRCWDQTANQRPLFPEVIKDLDEIILEIAINDEQGREWWKEKFFDDLSQSILEEVSWEIFSKDFEDKIQDEAPEKRAISLNATKAILAQVKPYNTNIEYVSMEYFGKVLGWFGPLDTLVDQILKTIQYPFFHGDLSNDEVARKFNGKKVGGYLIRLSQSVPGGYTISFIREAGGKSEVVNRRFIYRPSTRKFYIPSDETKQYDTLKEYVEEITEKCKLQEGIECETFQSLNAAITNTREYLE